MKRGTLCWIKFEPSGKGEFGKTRPALIVSNSEQNVLLNSVVAIPLSSRPPEIWPLRLEIPMPGAKPSFAVTPGIRQISKERVIEEIGTVSRETLDRVT